LLSCQLPQSEFIFGVRQYTQDPIHFCENWKKCRVVSPSARTLLYIHQYWRVSRQGLPDIACQTLNPKP